MALELSDCTFIGPAFPQPFVQFELEKELQKLKLLPKSAGDEGRDLQTQWDVYRRILRELVVRGGPVRIRNHVIEPLVERLGYARLESAGDVETRERQESGGTLMVTADGSARLRTWATDLNEDLDAPAKRGAAYRFSHLRIAQRVLLASGERFGLLTNGVELRLLISDPARPDSQIIIPIDPGWKRSRDVPDSFRVLLALACPAGVRAIPELVDKARLQQARVTKELRHQARQAVEQFVQEILDHPDNRDRLVRLTATATSFNGEPKATESLLGGDSGTVASGSALNDALPKQLWREGLVTIYRLLFILKLESSDDPARLFSFASTSLWRKSFSPSVALAEHARLVLERGAETGRLLEDGLRSLFRMFEEGLQCTELNVRPLGGALFGPKATPIISGLRWGERAVAFLLDRLLWTPKKRGAETRERVHYGSLDVEDLGRVYEALLELEPGITTQPMCRLRRQKLEVVVPVAQGEKYRPAESAPIAQSAGRGAGGEGPEDDELDDANTDDAEPDADDAPARGKKTKVEWIHNIAPGKFYLRVGLGRKASGSYYTPHSFVRFLVQETLGPQVAERSPQDNPHPLEILKLKVLDPAMGSGHFLVEACRFLGEKLYEACRLCDEKATELERKQERSPSTLNAQPSTSSKSAGPSTLDPQPSTPSAWLQRIIDLPDPDDELLRYLPSRSPEGSESGFSQSRAIAICRRLVATHCLYGVDKNPLAVELAKLALWLESHAEGMPLTFLDHRLVVGDSLTGPFWERLMFRPGSPKEPIEGLFHQGLSLKFTGALREAIRYVKDLDASVGTSLSDIENKARTKSELDRALLPFRVAAAAWSGGVMFGPESCDDFAYAELLKSIAHTGDLPPRIESERLAQMIARGLALDLPLHSGGQGRGEGASGAERSEAGEGTAGRSVSIDRDALYATVNSASCVPALPYDLTFPEVFYPTGVPHGRQGFHAVLGNPPWNKTNLEMPAYMGSFDLRFLEIETSEDRERLVQSYEATSAWQSWLTAAQEDDSVERAIGVLAPNAHAVDGGFGAGHADIFAPFVNRSQSWLRPNGSFGMMLPSAFHVSKSLKSLRFHLNREVKYQNYFCFENKRGLFEIHKSWKYTPVVFSNAHVGTTQSFQAQFYLHDDSWLFADRRQPVPFVYEVSLIEQMDPDTLIWQEFKSEQDIECAKTVFANGIPWKNFCERTRWQIRRELNATDDRWRIRYDVHPGRTWQPGLNALIHHQPGTVHQFTDEWQGADASAVPLENMVDKPQLLRLARFYRSCYRSTARATDERTAIYTLLPPGTTATNSLPLEGEPHSRSNALALAATAICNTFSFDWAMRLRVGSKTVSKFIMEVTPFAQKAIGSVLCVHGALRLIANHAGYGALWREQMGETWRESGRAAATWPVLSGDAARWAVRAGVDAVVADAYGLSRDQYAHVLSTFSHSSYPTAPTLCLAAFDELKTLGLPAFTRQHDPYYDIPLNESLPQPVIELPIPAESGEQRAEGETGEFQLAASSSKRLSRRSTKK